MHHHSIWIAERILLTFVSMGCQNRLNILHILLDLLDLRGLKRLFREELR